MSTHQSLAHQFAKPTNAIDAKPTFAHQLQHSKALVAIVAVLGVTVMALTAALVSNRSEAQSGGAAITPLASVAPANSGTAPKLNVEQPVRHPGNTPFSVNAHANPRSNQHGTASTMTSPASRAPVCSDCGTVQAVSAVQRQGQVNGVAVGNTTVGLGTVAGGVLGGLLGHQMGGGSGKTAMTVLGAAGGAYAGNTVEKNMNKVTVYAVRVRMDDGSTRHFEVHNAVALGSKVVIEGKNLRLAPAPNLAAG